MGTKYERTDEVLTAEEFADLMDYDIDEMPDSPVEVCAGEWRSEGRGKRWRMWVEVER